MTLNAVIAFILCFFPPNSTDFQADYITVVEVDEISHIERVIDQQLTRLTIADMLNSIWIDRHKVLHPAAVIVAL